MTAWIIGAAVGLVFMWNFALWWVYEYDPEPLGVALAALVDFLGGCLVAWIAAAIVYAMLQVVGVK